MCVLIYIFIGFICASIILWFSYEDRGIFSGISEFVRDVAFITVILWPILMPMFILHKIIELILQKIVQIKRIKK